MNNPLSDIIYALKTLRHNLGFAVLAVVCLGLGIGISTAVFSLIDAVMLRPLPYNQPDEIVMLFTEYPKVEVRRFGSAGSNFTDWRARAHSFSAMEAFECHPGILQCSDNSERLNGWAVTPGFFNLLGLTAELGRTFSPEETLRATHPVIVLSHHAWKQYFGGNKNVVGQTLTLDTIEHTIIGVMPEHIGFLDSDIGMKNHGIKVDARVDYWVPSRSDLSKMGRSLNAFGIVARLKNGVSITQAREEMKTLAAQTAHENPVCEGLSISVLPLKEVLVGRMEDPLLSLLGGAIAVFLIACANVSNLLLVRGMSRQRELAVRSALGAQRGDLVRLLVSEGLVLAGVGALLGAATAYFILKTFLWLTPIELPRLEGLSVTPNILLCILLFLFVGGFLISAAPAFRLSRANMKSFLNESGRGGSLGKEHRRLTDWLVAAEIALAIVLLFVGSLFVNNFRQLMAINPGYETDNVLTMGIKLSSLEPAIKFYRQGIEEISNLPGVKGATVTTGLPLTGDHSAYSAFFEGHSEGVSRQDTPQVQTCAVDIDYFNVLGVKLLEGRFFDERDEFGTPPVVIVSESLARRGWPEESAIGKKIGITFWSDFWREVVGVVEDVRIEGLATPSEFEVYVPTRQVPTMMTRLVVKTSGDPLALLAPVKAKVLEIDNVAAIYDETTFHNIVMHSVALPRFLMTLLLTFSVAGLGLAAVGIYSVTSYAVSQRTHEIGIRNALGASTARICLLIVKDSARVMLTGVVCGTVVALLIRPYINKHLIAISSANMTCLVGAVLVLLIAALLASLVPAIAASRMKPYDALKDE